MQIREVIQYLESIAPLQYQESYDNAGLIVGDAGAKVKGALVCLDSTEEVVEEAIQRKCNLIVAHHPIVFKGLKKITGKSYVERVVIKAIKHDIAIYAAHTNLDNVFRNGVNARIAQQIGLVNNRILAPKNALQKLTTHVSGEAYEEMEEKLRSVAGANGDFSIRTVDIVNNYGNGENRHVKLEVVFQAAIQHKVLHTLFAQHEGLLPFYEIKNLENQSAQVGSGMIGELERPMEEKEFLTLLKERMETSCIRHTALLEKKVKRIALCGGAGSFLLGAAMAQQADVFITGDYKYHDFFDADKRIIIADIGHYESEQFTIKLLQEIISKKFSNFAAYCTKVTTNPVHYF